MKTKTVINQNAFTLVEVLIAVSIFTMVIVGTFAAFMACNRIWQSTSLDIQTAREANMALARILYGTGTNDGIRAASDITVDTQCAGSAAGLTLSAPYPDGSWRMTVINYDGRTTLFDYNNLTRTIIYIPHASNTAVTEPIATNITFATAAITNIVSAAGTNSTSSSVTTNTGLNLLIRSVRQHGNFISTNQAVSFIRIRNK